MNFEANNIYHVYNRGNNQETLFYNHDNYLFFLKKIRNHLSPLCELMAYCLMPNHFHFLIYAGNKYASDGFKPSDAYQPQPSDAYQPQPSDAYKPSDAYQPKINHAIAIILRSYAQAINKQQKRTGSLFQQKTKAKNLSGYDDSYLLVCFNYIHQNPINAGLVEKIEDWGFSSFRDYAGLRKGTLCNRWFTQQLVPMNFERFVEESYGVIDNSKLEGIF